MKPARRRFVCLHERLLAHVVVDSATQCHIWQLRAHGRRGHRYPRLNIRAYGKHRMVAAHRAALVLQECGAGADIREFWNLYELYTIAGFEADHREHCSSPLCINAAHLQWLTRDEHYSVTVARGQGIGKLLQWRRQWRGARPGRRDTASAARMTP